MRKTAITILLVLGIVTVAMAKSVTLMWTAPADDKGLPTEGPVTSYILGYSNQTITEANFANCTRLATGTPKAINATETYTYDLPDNKVYFFAVKSVDKAGNVSPLSNVPTLDFFYPTNVTDLRASNP